MTTEEDVKTISPPGYNNHHNFPGFIVFFLLLLGFFKRGKGSKEDFSKWSPPLVSAFCRKSTEGEEVGSSFTDKCRFQSSIKNDLTKSMLLFCHLEGPVYKIELYFWFLYS